MLSRSASARPYVLPPFAGRPRNCACLLTVRVRAREAQHRLLQPPLGQQVHRRGACLQVGASLTCPTAERGRSGRCHEEQGAQPVLGAQQPDCQGEAARWLATAHARTAADDCRPVQEPHRRHWQRRRLYHRQGQQHPRRPPGPALPPCRLSPTQLSLLTARSGRAAAPRCSHEIHEEVIRKFSAVAKWMNHHWPRPACVVSPPQVSPLSMRHGADSGAAPETVTSPRPEFARRELAILLPAGTRLHGCYRNSGEHVCIGGGVAVLGGRDVPRDAGARKAPQARAAIVSIGNPPTTARIGGSSDTLTEIHGLSHRYVLVQSCLCRP
jgi:hypothetical protein